jgi:deoxyadenosine/deoxycytidine kinase
MKFKNSISQRGKLIGIVGLPATGKSTLVKHLSQIPGVIEVPERTEWLCKSQNFKKIPVTIEDKKAKQELFLEIDCERYKWAQNCLDKADIILCISDFTFPLAYMYAERWLLPEMDLYEWLVEKYCSFIDQGKVGIAHSYIYLDATLYQRQNRRELNKNQPRSNLFFEDRFSANMRRFYYDLIHPLSDRKVLPAVWYDYSHSCDEEFPALKSVIYSLGNCIDEVDLESFKTVLLSTVKDTEKKKEN